MRAFRNAWKSWSASARASSTAKPVRDPDKVRGARVAEAGAHRARSAARGDDQRTAPRADRAGDRRDQPAHGGHGERRQVLTARSGPSTPITTAPSTTSIASPGRSAISTGRRSPIRFDRSRVRASIALYPRPDAPARDIRNRPTIRNRPAIRSPQSAWQGHRRRPATFPGPLGVEAVPRLALVAARQPVERQPPPDRSLRRRRCGRRPGRRRAAVYHYAPDRHALERALRVRRRQRGVRRWAATTTPGSWR